MSGSAAPFHPVARSPVGDSVLTGAPVDSPAGTVTVAIVPFVIPS